jgi:hypothetical protein
LAFDERGSTNGGERRWLKTKRRRRFWRRPTTAKKLVKEFLDAFLFKNDLQKQFSQ